MRFIRKLGKSAKRILTRKHGPLPTWAWVAVGSVAIILYRRHQSGSPWPWQKKGTQGDTGQGNPAYTSPNTPPDLFYQPGGGVPVDNSGAFPSSGGDVAGLLAILRMLLNGNRRHKKEPKHRHKYYHEGHPPKGLRRALKQRSVHGGHAGAGPGRPRSNAHHRNEVGGRGTGRHPGTGIKWYHLPHRRNHPPQNKHPGPIHIPRGSKKIPLVGHSPRHTTHPIATHPRAVPMMKASPRPAPRPSAPPKRTQRTRRK